MMIKKNDYKNDPCDKEYIAEKGIISRISISDSNGRKVPSEQELPDTGSIKDNKKKGFYASNASTCNPCWLKVGTRLSEGKVSSVDVKNPCKEAKNSAHRDLGRNGGLED